MTDLEELKTAWLAARAEARRLYAVQCVPIIEPDNGERWAALEKAVNKSVRLRKRYVDAVLKGSK